MLADSFELTTTQHKIRFLVRRPTTLPDECRARKGNSLFPVLAVQFHSLAPIKSVLFVVRINFAEFFVKATIGYCKTEDLGSNTFNATRAYCSSTTTQPHIQHGSHYTDGPSANLQEGEPLRGSLQKGSKKHITCKVWL